MNISDIFSIDPFEWIGIGTTLFCGILVGLERQLRGKPVGIRTASLIALGTYLFVAASISVQTDSTDTSRIIGQVVTGVGFLGAGVMLTKDGMVLGVTSAATIWVLAAIGVVVATSYSLTAIKLALLVVGILWGVELLEGYSSALTRGVHSKVSRWHKRGPGHSK